MLTPPDLAETWLHDVAQKGRAIFEPDMAQTWRGNTAEVVLNILLVKYTSYSPEIG